MYYSNMKSIDISKCLLCHDAVCTKVCPAMDPARDWRVYDAAQRRRMSAL